MTNSAFLFPGQGCQVVGMGKEFYDNFSVSKHVYQEVDEVLSRPLSKMIFEGPKELLNSTENTQVALMTVSIAIYAALMHELGGNVSDYCDMMAGHSLGEYTAHVAAGSITLQDCAKALQHRGNYMANAHVPGAGAMVACIGIQAEELQKVIMECNTENSSCQIANDNSIGQIVISGDMTAIDAVIAALKQQGFKAIKLNVSAAFHSKLMAPALAKMELVLDKLKIDKPSVPIITNVSVSASQDPEFLKRELQVQICGQVSWRQTIDLMIDQGITQFVEIGAGNVLTNLLKRSWKDREISAINISTIKQMNDYIKNIK